MRKNPNLGSGANTTASVKSLSMTQQSQGVQLAIRTELFEHGVFPTSAQGKITSQILIDTFTNLNLLSSIDYKIKLQSWIDQATKHIPGMSPSDAQVYF